MSAEGQETYYQNLEVTLLNKLGLSDLHAGHHVIRDERGWRQNEKYIDYLLIIHVNRSFAGVGGLLKVKFDEKDFHDIKNCEEFVLGVFHIDPIGVLQSYFEKELSSFDDSVIKKFGSDPFDANKGITLDGISYRIHALSPNIDTVIKVNNPNTPDWKKWETEVFNIGSHLSQRSKIEYLISLFK